MSRERPRLFAGLATRRSDAVSPRTTIAIAGRSPEPGTQTRDQRSASVQHTYRWWQSPQRDFAEKSSRFATAASKVAPYISTPSTGPPQSPASKARHGSRTRPTGGFPRSSAGSDHADHDRSSAALPYFEISNARRLWNQRDATAGWSPAEPPGPHQAGSATTWSSIRAARDRCHAVEDEVVPAAKQCRADGGETNSRLQAGSAT